MKFKSLESPDKRHYRDKMHTQSIEAGVRAGNTVGSRTDIDRHVGEIKRRHAAGDPGQLVQVQKYKDGKPNSIENRRQYIVEGNTYQVKPSAKQSNQGKDIGKIYPVDGPHLQKLTQTEYREKIIQAKSQKTQTQPTTEQQKIQEFQSAQKQVTQAKQQNTPTQTQSPPTKHR
jgi:hypothetical protein